jgi:hypothetical protein
MTEFQHRIPKQVRALAIRVNVCANALTAPERLRLAHHEEHGLCQTLQNREIALVKSKGLRRENLQQSHDLTLVPDGCGRYRANTEFPAGSRFGAGIGFGIVATQGFSGTYALAGETRVDIYMSSERWSAASDAGPAHHRTSVDDRDGRARAAQERPRAFADHSQRRIQVRPKRIELVLN